MSVARTPCYIGIGANLGDARDTVTQAIALIGKLPQTQLAATSSLFSTAPVDAGGDDYVNAVVKIDTRLQPIELLQALQALEQDFGRQRPYRNAPRTLDLDILLYGDKVITQDSLEIPHPRMTQRAFVLIPLLEIDPFITIPKQGPAHNFVPAVAGQAIRKI
ncbi:2-amino-4-hydroxy-6-hydroxymethyldihydropteridine diphosphokinase [Noviherbaspirillum sp. ST9]|uniref:2-amino-4-hydroxy-6- hydroxymethyldihydropteridine diphosphokinase n=1 Tax=Noviherbaspirillum sp. ST9 TaxID=3401606 RepID=UPI003B5862D6